ncbi:hypothetical protein D3C75_1277690 [compost metagenome]
MLLESWNTERRQNNQILLVVDNRSHTFKLAHQNFMDFLTWAGATLYNANILNT